MTGAEKNTTEENSSVEEATKAQKIALAAIATTLAEPALMLAHTGGPGVIAGIIVGGFAYAYSDEIVSLFGGRGRKLPLAAGEEDDTSTEVRAAKQRNAASKLAYRLFVGKSQRGEPGENGEGETDEEMYDQEPDRDDGCIDLGPNLRPHVDTLLSRRVVILGMPGAGKGNVVADLVEELGQFDAAMVIFDKKPEYGPLAQQPYMINPFRANAQNLTLENAAEFGRQIMQKRLQVVVDLASYRNDADAARIMNTLVNSIGMYQEELTNEQRIPCTFVLEEAHYWLPESEGLSTVRAVKLKNGSTLLNLLQQTFFNLANIGRSFGLGLIVSTQRPANIDKRLISSAEWRFLLKAMEPADLKIYKGYGLEAEQAMNLDPNKGEAYIIGPNIRGMYQIRRRFSPDEAKTPGLENIRRGQNGPSTSQASDVSTSGPTSQASSFSASGPTSTTRPDLHLVNTTEGSNEEARSENEVGEVDEAGTSPLTEREKHIAKMFFQHNQGINVIMRELYPGVTGGAQYQKANAEIADALRKYVQVRQGA